MERMPFGGGWTVGGTPPAEGLERLPVAYSIQLIDCSPSTDVTLGATSFSSIFKSRARVSGDAGV